MGSRIGSIAILLVIGAIVAAVVVIITRLDLLNTGEPDAPVIVVSLDDGELVLLNEPQSITVTISSGSPIATLELLVDEAKVAEVIPPYSAERGAWIGSFVWTPERLGFANVRIVALDAQGLEFSQVIQVEVTDDAARVAASLRLVIEGIAPLQQFPVESVIRIQVEASGGSPIERIDMLLDDEHVASVPPRLHEDGKYRAAFEWIPPSPGEINVTLAAVDADGRSEVQTIPVIVVEPGAATPLSGARSAEGEDDTTSESSAESGTEGATDRTAEASARIESPQDGARFTLDSNLAIDVQVVARGVGPVASTLLYLTPVAPNNTLGNSVLIHSSEGNGGAEFSERVEDVEQWITSSGTYELQLVVFTPEQDRYDHRIRFHVVADAGDEDQPSPPDSELSDEVDLAIVTARQADDDPTRLNVSITNSSSVDIERVDVLITVADANDGSELAVAEVTLGIESQDLRTIPLDLKLEAGVEVQALVLLEASADSNAANNVFPVTLAAVPAQAEPDQVQQQEQAAQDEAVQQEQESEDRQPQEPAEPGPAPDLALLDIQATSDGYVLLTVINNGDGEASTFTIVIADGSGTELETISRRDADGQPLVPGAAEILTSLLPHSGTVVITVVASSSDGERNLGDNTQTYEVP